MATASCYIPDFFRVDRTPSRACFKWRVAISGQMRRATCINSHFCRRQARLDTDKRSRLRFDTLREG
jgi:hypothetical protein